MYQNFGFQVTIFQLLVDHERVFFLLKLTGLNDVEFLNQLFAMD